MVQNPPKSNQNHNTNQTNQNPSADSNQSSQANQTPLTPPNRVIATQEALALISRLMQENQDTDTDTDKTQNQIIFIQSGGCCEGSVPICTLRGDFALGEADILIGNIGGADFYLHQSMLEYYKSTQLIIDAKEGFGSEYSLEYGSGWKFELSLRLFSDEEIALL